jgi:hypothetical protein
MIYMSITIKRDVVASEATGGFEVVRYFENEDNPYTYEITFIVERTYA